MQVAPCERLDKCGSETGVVKKTEFQSPLQTTGSAAR